MADASILLDMATANIRQDIKNWKNMCLKTKVALPFHYWGVYLTILLEIKTPKIGKMNLLIASSLWHFIDNVWR